MTTIHFDKKLKCGSDYVAVEVLDTLDELKVGNLVLPDSVSANARLAHCKVTDIGQNAKDKTGVEAGDYVMIDRLSTFAWTAPSAVLKYDSVIMKTDEKRSTFSPLKDCAFIEPDEKNGTSEVNGLLVVNYDKRLNTGTVTSKNFDTDSSYPFNVGDKVMLVKGGDKVDIDGKTMYIYKKDMIICTVEEK